jgi:DNA-binding MarR family transcriptional regulator
VFTEIAIIEHLSRNRLERALPDGLKVSHFGVLNHMVRLGDGQNPVDLARALQVNRGAMTNTLQRLEARGLVAVQPDPEDGRGKRVYLTSAGREAREAGIAVALQIVADLDHDGALSEALLAALPALRELRSALDRERGRDRRRANTRPGQARRGHELDSA